MMIPNPQPNNPLHGLTLEIILTKLVAQYGWVQLSKLIPIRCFYNEPSIKSSLKFLRQTPWARKSVEDLYLASTANQGKE
ncbi:MAG: VF530 family DNA-binding protein [Anaerolineaceae bacterium]